MKLFFIIAISIILVSVIDNKRAIIAYFSEIIRNRKLVFNLSKNDFKTKFAGSYLGIIWAFVQPIVTICVYWFVFSVGLRQGDVGEVPYALWFVSGLVPWFFFSDALTGGTNALLEYNYLVKKVVFNINTLPVVKVLSATYVHIFFALFTVAMYTFSGFFPGITVIQLIYYSVCIFAFALGLVYFTSACVVFFRDLSQIISIVLQVGIWLTPIMWRITILENENLRKIFYLNPFYYIVQGYRDSLIDKVWFWDPSRYQLGIYFWSIVIILFLGGTKLFRKLQPHFADVL